MANGSLGLPPSCAQEPKDAAERPSARLRVGQPIRSTDAREPAAPGLGVLRLRPRGAQPIRSTARREPAHRTEAHHAGGLHTGLRGWPQLPESPPRGSPHHLAASLPCEASRLPASEPASSQALTRRMSASCCGEEAGGRWTLRQPGSEGSHMGPADSPALRG